MKQIKIEQLDSYCTTLTRNLMKGHEKRFGDRIRSVREASAGLNNAGARLAAGVKNAWGTMEKQASEYGMRLAQTIQENTQNLSREEAASSYHEAGIFHQDAVRTLNEIILTVRRYVPKLQRMLKPEMAALNSSLVRLERSVMDLGTTLDASPGHKLESLHRDVETIQEKQRELLRLESEENAEQALIEASSSRQTEFESREHELLSSAEFLELGKYEESLKHKEDEIKQLLQPLTKPLLKLERLAATKQGPPVDVKTLRDLINAPIETVMAGQRLANTQLLGLLEENLVSGKLEILDRKRRKVEEVIEAVKQGALDRARDEYLTLQANTQETLRQLKSKGLLDKRDELDQQLREARSQIELARTRQKELRRRIDELTIVVSKLEASIESQINKVAHESVTITTE
jgi:DNA repair exonuclease SbcCD ATPase subunit